MIPALFVCDEHCSVHHDNTCPKHFHPDVKLKRTRMKERIVKRNQIKNTFNVITNKNSCACKQSAST